ncbi:hypothetical protein MJO29_015058, partial [Puccinia striiformis f. sp. tritici]
LADILKTYKALPIPKDMSEVIGPAARSPETNTEAHLKATVLSNGRHQLAECDMVCRGCKALHWPEERALEDIRKNNNIFSMCCQTGKVKLPAGSPLAPEAPNFLKNLLKGTEDSKSIYLSCVQVCTVVSYKEARRFQKFIRTYNNSVSCTSLGFVIDGKSASASRGPVFTLNGRLVHKIGAITPGVRQQPPNQEAQKKMDPKLILMLQNFLYKYNPYAKLYQQAGNVLNVLKTGKRVSMVFKTVGLVIEGGGEIKAPREIVLHQRNGQLKFISDLHSSYFPLQYPLFFPWGSQQWEPTYQSLMAEALMKVLLKLKRLGVVVCYFSTIEFQKRGMPHLHLMLTLSKDSTPDTPEKIDAIFELTARLPAVQHLSLHEANRKSLTPQLLKPNATDEQREKAKRERYYIRLLLLHRKNVVSFEDLRTVDGNVCSTFREAADTLGLPMNDRQYDGAQFKTGRQLRLMFAIISQPTCCTCEKFEDHWRNLGNNVPHLLASKYNLLNVSDGQVKAFTLHLVDQIPHSMGSNLGLVCLKLDSRFKTFVEYVSVGDTTSDACVNIEEQLRVNEDLLNGGQKIFYHDLSQLLMTSDKTPFTLYLDGPGGTGKTFLLNTLVDSLVVAGEHPVVVASTGVAALLLSGGQTAHSGLGIPIKSTPEIYWRLTREDTARIRVPGVKVKSRESADECFGLAIAHVFSGIGCRQVQAEGSLYEKYLSERCILCPLNADARDVNGKILESIKGDNIESHSIDWPNERASNALPEETLINLSFAGFPEHKLKLKKGIPVVLLRNLNISEGLCNGTQLLVI